MEGSEGSGPARWRQCGKLVQAVRAGTQEKKFYDESVKALRAQLSGEFEALLLEEYTYAQSKAAEQMLWKTVFYTVIEEFRRRIKAATAQGEKGSEPLRKTTTVFVKFLREASTFYALLTLKLQATFGQLGFALEFPGLDDLAAATQQTDIPEYKTSLDCRISIYRCLICLGDLARYEEMTVKDANSKKDWSRAEQFYYQAVDVFPEGGNSFNQLAVLATYNEAHLQAVCHYFRSLAVAHPFQVARENLLLLFDQARAKYERLPSSQATPAVPGKGAGRGRAKPAQKPRAPIAQLLPVLAIRFAHAHGVLFCKINLDSFIDILEGAFADLDDLLARSPVARGGNGEARRSDAIVMQLTAMCLFAAWNADYSPPGRPAGYSETLQCAEVKRHVWTLTFGLAARLAFAAACVGDISMLHAGALLTSPLLPPLNLLLQWMATQQDIFRSHDVDATEVKERAAFWGALCKLLLLMPSPEQSLSSDALPEDWQLRAFGPLNAAHQHLDFHLPRTEKDDGELRLQRILRSLKCIADMLPEQASDQAAQAAQSLSPPRQEELAAAAGFQRAVLRMFGAHDKAPATSPAPDVHMHEDVGPDENMPHVDATVEAPDQAEEPAQQADVDDDMDEDEERILYNPTQTPVKATPEPAQPQTASQAAQEQTSKIPEPIMASGAGHDDAGLPDILDQLMADGLVQDVPAAKADDANINNATGNPRGDGTFSPLSVYGQATPQPATAAEPASDAVAPVGSAAQLPRDLSDANLGLLEVPEQEEQPDQTHADASDLMQTLQGQYEQQYPPSVRAYIEAHERSRQADLAASGRLPTGQYNPMQAFQHQPQQRLYSGPGTVAPPPSALPDPGSLTASQAQISCSTAAGGRPQANGSSVQPVHVYLDMLAARQKADGSLATPAAESAGAAGLPSGQRAASGAHQQSNAAGSIATPDNGAGLNAWQAITDGQQGSANTAAAAARPTPGASLSGLPALNAGSFMREGESAGKSGGFLGRDLFANQRSELSRRASPASMWEAPDQPLPATVLNSQLQPTPGILPSSLHAGNVPGSLQGPYGISTLPSGYEGATGGFYINKDKQPQVPAAPKLGGFYQRDARDVEAQLLAQAYAARTGQPAASQPAPSQAPDISNLPQESAYGRSIAQPGVNVGIGGASSKGSRAQSPAVSSTAQHGAAGVNLTAQLPTAAGPWAAGRPLPGNAAALLGQPGQLPGSLLGSGLPQPPQPALWPTQPNQLGQQPGGYNLFPGSLGTNMAVNSSMPGLGLGLGLGNLGTAAGQGLPGFPGYLGQYGAPNAGNGYQSAYGLQNGAVHLGSGQPTAQQGFAGLSNLQLQQRLALLQESSGVGLPGQGLQASSTASLFGQPAQQAAQPDSSSFSWLDAFQARQETLRAQAAGATAPSAFPFPGASADATMRLGNPNEPWRAH